MYPVIFSERSPTEETETPRRLPNRHIFLRLMKYVAKYWYFFVLGLVLMVVSNYLSIVPRLVTRDVLNALTPPVIPDLIYSILPGAIITIVGVSVLSSAISFVQRYLQQYISQKTVYDIRKSLFNALIQKSFSFYDRSRVGDIVSRVTSDTDQVQMMTSMWVNEVATIVAQFAIWIGVLVSINAPMTAICLVSAPFTVLITNRYAKIIGPIFSAQRRLFSEMNTFLQQNIVGMRIVRIFRGENRERKKFSTINKTYFDTQIQITKKRATYPGLNTMIMGIITAFIYWYGGRLIIQTFGTPMEFKWGDLIIFVQGMQSLMMPLRFLSTIASSYSEAMAAGARIFDILDTEPEVKDKPDAVVLPPIKGEVVFENVYFGYNPEKPVLKNVSFTVKPGETLAILGPTGSGKSTILYLIPRFYDVTGGKITIDGYDIREVQLKSLREQIGIALQDIFLFSATIKENIAYGRPDATEEEIIEAAKAAQIHDFITSLPDGYNSIVGERGVTLSGGQKQRLTIARTLLKDPKILIFDDTTSFVDTETEHKIQKALEALLKNRTAFIVTQRLSAIKGANKIIVLRDGEIAESGSHEELLARNGIYAAIYQTQFAPREEILAREVQGGK
jgi:ATP-binding cassette subfamily B protein